MEEIYKSEWGGEICYSHGFSHSKGIMILFNPKFDFQTASIVADKNGRSLIAGFTVHDCTFVLCNVYARNDNSQQTMPFDFYLGWEF